MSIGNAKKGSWFLKILGIVTLVGIVIAIGRMVMKVLGEEDGGESDDAPQGV